MTLSGRLIFTPSSVPLRGREFWPIVTAFVASPGFISSGSAQPSIHLSQMPMWVGIDWKIGPACDPDDIRSQKSMSELPAPEVS